MARLEMLTTSAVLAGFNLRAAYYLGYSLLFGMSVWVTFVGGFIALKALPRHQFGALQHKTFPVYFNMSLGITLALLGLWHRGHPAVLPNISNPRVADVAQAYALGSVVLAQGINQFIVGPLTSKTMFQRHKLEKEEGKAYNEPGVSPAMKALNSRFSQLHGISSLLNLSAVIATALHGSWIANRGVGRL